jgi:NADH:ubiquinone oxidoreductase subunit E
VTASLDIYDYLRRSLGIRKDETTRDGMFSLEIVNCLGSCNTAPNMMINNKLYSSLTVSRVEEILEVLAAGGKI